VFFDDYYGSFSALQFFHRILISGLFVFFDDYYGSFSALQFFHRILISEPFVFFDDYFGSYSYPPRENGADWSAVGGLFFPFD
jgi:hypothetical protein